MDDSAPFSPTLLVQPRILPTSEETLAFHPSGKFFLMVGRIFKGDWNAALFDYEPSSRLLHQNFGFRISTSTFTPDRKRLSLGGADNQG